MPPSRRLAAACVPGLLALSLLAAAQDTATPAPERDRAAILAMQGEYDVEFAFDETVIYQPGYEHASAKRSGGSELVLVVEDAPGKIVLQHLLVHAPTGHVTKHWRQDWTWEAERRFEFGADQTWHVRDLPAELTRGAWTQCVYEVSDAPRYCGTGRWEHDGPAPTWTSDAGWRPLPRREYTTRGDYDALKVVNRHTIVPGGWTHEQDNLKVVRDDQGGVGHVVVREFGFNDYRHEDEVDFSPAREYWEATSGYWARVRERWDALLQRPPGLRLRTAVDGMAIIEPLFTQAQRVQEGERVADAEIDIVFAEWVEPATPPR